MWQAPSHRIRALATAKRRARERQRLAIHIKQVDGELRLANPPAGMMSHPVKTRVILNDLGPRGLGLFANEPFGVGQDIELSIAKPKEFQIRGKVAWCHEYHANSHVISGNPFSYRLGIVFIFNNPDEEQMVKAYCDELARGYLYGVPAYATPTNIPKAA